MYVEYYGCDNVHCNVLVSTQDLAVADNKGKVMII